MIELRAVSTGYRGRPVLANVHLAPVPSGALVAVVGPNAVGKSTLLRAVAGLRRYRGEILLDGHDLAWLSLTERLRRVGYLPQSLPQPSALVAYEVVLSALRAGCSDFGAREAEAAVDEVFGLLGLRELALRRLGELSGGQRQMIGLAQVIARRPRLLLLDEPTSALDLRWQIQVLEAVRGLALREAATCVLAIHDLNLALRFCDHVVVLGRGGVLAAGDPASTFDAELLQTAYGVSGRVERCSLGHQIVIVDGAGQPHHQDQEMH
ncbi:ABC transporter related protein [Thioalkalivibrio nitratireducens DSM 14787]|uniref:ABC transporter related protein n=1 Tax=Thioalkalivibrio nitratireducens (strain DSM 14787 / UNIQEM 213 / ALEN2) TaxID=1255043 RepID=L0DXI3_THIND|nr:ABC transporter ATP-binding protein [Thioalkalivibrio nitratireducens]AGA34299.1 ABC transporter related protein [Thioalkalivibrio nitratireducens DSM 14787]